MTPTLAFCLALLSFSGCAKQKVDSIAVELPEEQTVIEKASPTEILADGADSLDPTPRARSLALLLASEPVESWAARAIHDPDPWVQRSAVEVLAMRLPGSEASAALRDVVEADGADPYVAGLAARSLPGPDAELAAALEKRLGAASEPWERAPLGLAASAHGSSAGADALLAAVRTGELALEVEFVLALGRSEVAGMKEALAMAAERVEPELMLPVAVAQLMLGDSAGEAPLRKAIVGADSETRLEALDYLVSVEHEAVEGLIKRARSAGPETVEWYADLALAARAGERPELFGKAMEQSREIRELAVRLAVVAGQKGGTDKRMAREAHGVVAAALTDDHPSVRAEGARAAARLQMSDVAPAIESLLTDQVSMVRIEAAGAALALR